MPASNYLRTKVTDLALRGVPFTAPANVYISLHTTNPTEVPLLTEVVGAWYARQVATFAAQVIDGQTANSNTLTYSAVTGSAVTVTHFAIWDAATTGNMLFYGALAASKTFSITDVPSWLPGQLASNAV